MTLIQSFLGILAMGHLYDLSEWERMKPITPLNYVCCRAPSKIQIDGKLDDEAWDAAQWTSDFVDIEGTVKSKPRFRTRVKMLWDDEYIFFAAELEEPHICGMLTEKNAVIYHDNDFEIFLDPDADNHNYYEFEMNALNTIWELTLPKAYRDGGDPKLGTNIDGLKSAVAIEGTINNPVDTDQRWTLEIAIPWQGLAQYNRERSTPPRDGDTWRLNFSRVEWRYGIVDGKYSKLKGREDNWVWSPQGVVDMHRPERWGFLQFSTKPAAEAKFIPDPTLAAREELMELYYKRRAEKKPFVEKIALPDGRRICIREDSLIWIEDGK